MNAALIVACTVYITAHLTIVKMKISIILLWNNRTITSLFQNKNKTIPLRNIV